MKMDRETVIELYRIYNTDHLFLAILMYPTGESNAGKYDLYSCQFPAMISDWRQKFHIGSDGETSDQFPFGFVQVNVSCVGKDITEPFWNIWHPSFWPLAWK